MLYKKMWNALAEAVPKSWNIPKMRLLKSLRSRRELIKQGKQLAQRADRLFTQLFATTSGSPSYEAYVEKIKRSDKPGLKRAIELVEDQVEVCIHRPEGARWWVMRTGLYNQHVTLGSKGLKNIKLRNLVEATYLGMTMAEYTLIDGEVKANYGTIRPNPHLTDVKPNNLVYGRDVYILNLRKVKDRLTFTPAGDSLNRYVGTASDSKSLTPTSWDQVFIPWKYRLLLAEPLAEHVGNGNFEVYRGIQPTWELATGTWGAHASYPEIQLLGGGIDLRLVEAFEFQQDPPEGEFLEVLKKFGIEIRDGRQWPPTIWEGYEAP